MKLNFKNFDLIFTICVFIALASLDNAAIGMLPPLFSSIAHDMNFHVSVLGMISAVNIFVISASSIVWAYLADKSSRKRLIIIGTVIWSISVFFTAHSRTFLHLLMSQFLTGIGLGCIASIGFSVLTDSVSKKWRGTMMSLWAMSQGFGTIAGSLMASTIAPATSWRRPFEVLAILGLLFIVLYFFIKEPQRGASEPELKSLIESGHGYNYSIELKQVKELIKKKSNRWLILETLFVNIANGTLIWLPTLFIAKLVAEGVNPGVAIVAAGFLYALSQAGGVISIYLGYIGDRLQRKFYGGRALFASIVVFLSAPVYVLMFITPMKNIYLPDSTNPVTVFIALIGDIFTRPWVLLLFLLALIASAANSANYPNWLAMLIDVNLPEHRATIFSTANLVTGTGRAIGNALLGTVLGFVSIKSSEPTNYIITLSVFQFFIIPGVIFFFLTSKSCRRDIKDVKSILAQRAELAKER